MLVSWHVNRKRFGIPLAVLLLALLGVLAWESLRPRDRLFHGKPQSEWIKSITYFGDDAQLKAWRALGPDGLHLAGKDVGSREALPQNLSLDDTEAARPPEPPPLSLLPKPSDSHQTRMCVHLAPQPIGQGRQTGRTGHRPRLER